ncbi:MAG: RNA-guided endonuclease TnpB family protein [Syntrophorhabdales bacterium]
MTISRAYKYRLYPKPDQFPFLSRHFGSCRFVYNHFLDLREKSCAAGTPLSGFACKRMLPSLKEEHPWLKEINSQSLQQSVLTLELAYRGFFKGLGKHPVFKSKHGRQSFRVPQHLSIRGNCLYIPKMKTALKMKLHRPVAGEIKSCTISRTPSGKFFVSFAVEQEIDTSSRNASLPAASNVEGYDLGLVNFTTSSSGEKVETPKFLRKSLGKIEKLQRSVSRKKKGSKNRDKARIRLARCHEHIANQRSDFLHKQSRKAVDENQVLCLEDLNVKGMMLYGRLGLSVGDAALGEFVRQVSYKALWSGKRIARIGRFYPSTKTCSECWLVNDHLMLNDREWTCRHCGTVHDRDHNAAKVIKTAGPGR